MEEKEKTAGDLRREALFYNPKNGFDRIPQEEIPAMNEYCEQYRQFLDAGKTEREAVWAAIALAEARGFRPIEPKKKLKPGDKVYRSNRDKALFLAVIGTEPLSAGVNIGAAHVDAPRLDLKQNPLYEESELAYFKTHYYGGIRKYQWLAIPLELRGVVALKDRVVPVDNRRGAGRPRLYHHGPSAPFSWRAE
jgi:aspartyl aminopeptidase